jgi:hypothetical protein
MTETFQPRSSQAGIDLEIRRIPAKYAGEFWTFPRGPVRSSPNDLMTTKRSVPMTEGQLW